MCHSLLVLLSNIDSIFGLAQDDIMKRTIQGRVNHVIIRLDPTNSVNSPVGGNYARHYETTLQCKSCRRVH